MRTLRTPDERFVGLPDYPFEPNYVEISDQDGGTLRVHYLDEGPHDAAPVLCMHGEPSFSDVQICATPASGRPNSGCGGRPVR